MTAGAAGVKALDWRRIGHALVEAEGVIDVMNVAEGDAEMLLNLLWDKRKDIDDGVFESGGKLLGNA